MLNDFNEDSLSEDNEEECSWHLQSLSNLPMRPVLKGIANCSDESFSDDGAYDGPVNIIPKASLTKTKGSAEI